MRNLALGVFVTLLGSILFGCGNNDGGDLTVPPGATPQEVAEVAALNGVNSGSVEASLFVTKLKKNESVSFRFNGSFKQLGEGDLPQLFMAATSQGKWNGRNADFNSRLLVLPKGAEVTYGSTTGESAYAVEPSTLKGLQSKFEQAQADGGRGDVAACVNAAQEVNLAQLIRHPKLEDRREEADGSRVVVINGELVIPRLQDFLVGLAEDPDCGAQMEAVGLPSAADLKAARVDFKKGFGGPHLTLAIDKQGVIRELSTRFECARLNGELFELQLDFRLAEVNQAIDISGALEGIPLEKLLRKFGTTQDAALQAEGDEAVIAFLEGLGGALTGRRP